jgi:DNA-binding GntR family transcriptional regulator
MTLRDQPRHALSNIVNMAEDPRAYMRVYSALSARIGKALPSGERLNIGLIADEFEVSRPTVAHALQLLADEGKVTRYPGVGWVVE